ncbi:MAG TPA: helix-turn-helix transcriptional regulator [Fimbriimonas sp.]|nr:helix-turn-helix transcriptional regulator [Fimbriimonas sp.]
MRAEIPRPEGIKNLSEINRLVLSPSVVFGETTYKANGACGPRIQSDFQLVVILEGAAKVKLAGSVLQIPVNHVALMRPGKQEHFLFDAAGPTHHTWCAVPPQEAPAGFEQRVETLPLVLPLSARLDGLINLGLSLHGVEGDRDKLALSLGLACLAAFEFEASTGQVRPEAVSRALSLLENRLAEPWTVERLAAAVSVSPQHLIRLFKTHIGTTPAKHLWQTRTRRGLALLRETGLSVSEIADQLGFATPFHFARLIRQSYGGSPRELRAQAWSRMGPVNEPAGYAGRRGVETL